MKQKLLTTCLAILAIGTAAHAGTTVIQNKGSDTLVNVAQSWAEAYRAKNGSVVVAISGGGSGTGLAALINGTVDIANSSRTISRKEVEEATRKGIKPKEHIVGFDALAVFVHKNNPLEKVALTDLAEVYGEDGAIESWKQLGVDVPGCKNQTMVLVSRQNNSGTYAYFREAVLGERRDYKLGTHDMHGSKDVVDLVEKTPCAVGYSGLAYATDRVKMLCIAKKGEESCVRPGVETALDGSYPIARPLFMYTNGEPVGATKAYLDWILSDEGQCILSRRGYAPIRHVTCK
ncbi:MAG: phosphate ABC transporter substrate-binding protein [Candidatus Schekmanbacteria bacterium]|nr:phosphate ABC transporter substrate-binding protein [Candidatus Schekmanbacteria bacterium]